MQNKDQFPTATFVEPSDGTLWSICTPDQCSDHIRHIPSPDFQRYVREIVIGLDFLMKHDLYHGNLSWRSTLHSSQTVKLAGFKQKDSMDVKEAQWNDWQCLIKMLEEVSTRAHRLNQAIKSDPTLSQHSKYFCGTIDSLIAMIKGLDMTSLPAMKETILEDQFFWNFAKRGSFFSGTISLKLADEGFRNRIRSSNICEKSWDKNSTPEFQCLVTKMNDHREAERRSNERYRVRGGRRGQGTGRGHGGRSASKRFEPYNGDSSEDYVRCVCGGYTHHKQIKLNVDDIVRKNHPTICFDMKRILDTADG